MRWQANWNNLIQLAELDKLKINIATMAVYNKKSIAIVLRVFLIILTRLLYL